MRIMTEFKKINENVWEVEKEGDMNVPVRIYANQEMINVLKEEEKTNWSSVKQIKNGATLPGIQKYILALADVHPGYALPIGTVMAMDLNEGVINFGGTGYDVNCGVRSIKTPLNANDLSEKDKENLAEELFKVIPAGLGIEGEIHLSKSEVDEILVNGSEYSIKKGFGRKEDLEFTEEFGKMKNADPETVPEKAKQRQLNQLGTLGSGNHYLEVQKVERIFDEAAAKAFGLFQDQVIVFIHCGSRALGHQIGSDYLKILEQASKKYKLKILDKELVSAPINSEEGRNYWSAVNCGINNAFANRQVLTHLTRIGFSNALGVNEKEIQLIYDVAHNTCKKEKHEVNGEKKELLVHRKGATRGFGPGREEVPEQYRKVGQPVNIGGSMGTFSYILAGTEKAMKETFGSTVHGAGRTMSRHEAINSFKGEKIVSDLMKKGIIIKGHSKKGIAEEAPQCYKDVNAVIDVMHNSGISKKVAKLKPLISVKG